VSGRRPVVDLQSRTMEAADESDVPERLARSVDRVVLFLERLAETPALGTQEERMRLFEAATELRHLQADRLKREIRSADSESIWAGGFSRNQMEFKLAVAERALAEAEQPSVRGWLLPSRVWRALAKGQSGPRKPEGLE
jgi:hypothetical protein